MWELFPDHPNLLPAYEDEARLGGSFIRKLKLSREGANLQKVVNGAIVEFTSGDYGEEGFVYQALAPIPNFDRNYPVLGLWIVNHEAAGMGVREDTSQITGNLSRFVP